jgi:hypothetical protein
MTAHRYVLAACLVLTFHCGDDIESPPKEVDLDTTSADTKAAPLHVLPADETYAERSLTEWAVEYMRWTYSWTLEGCTSAEADTDGALCDLHQDPESPVFFLASCNYAEGRGVVADRSQCKIPAGKALLVPIAAFTDEAATNDEPITPEELEASTQEVLSTTREQKLVTNGSKLSELEPYSIGPVPFAFEIPAQPNWHTCNGFPELERKTVDPSYLVGYFALVAPPPPGKHEIEYASIYTYWNSDFYFHVKSKFAVE